MIVCYCCSRSGMPAALLALDYLLQHLIDFYHYFCYPFYELVKFISQ